MCGADENFTLLQETAFDDVRDDAKEKLAEILALLRHNT